MDEKTSKKSVTLISSKGAANAVMKYRKLRAAGKVGRVETLEELSKFFTKKGTVKKRETRYNPARKKFNELVDKMRTETGSKTPSVKRIKEQAARERLEKAKKSYSEKRVQDKRFKKKAREKAAQFEKMVDVFASETYNALRDGAYGVGSEIVEELTERGFSPDDIVEYLEQIRNTIDNIPAEARAYTENDDFWNAVIELSDEIKNGDSIDVPDVLGAYMTTDADKTDFFKALENYIASDNKTMPFSQAWEEVSQTFDPASFDNMQEILEGDNDDLL